MAKRTARLQCLHRLRISLSSWKRRAWMQKFPADKKVRWQNRSPPTAGRATRSWRWVTVRKGALRGWAPMQKTKQLTYVFPFTVMGEIWSDTPIVGRYWRINDSLQFSIPHLYPKVNRTFSNAGERYLIFLAHWDVCFCAFVKSSESSWQFYKLWYDKYVWIYCLIRR